MARRMGLGRLGQAAAIIARSASTCEEFCCCIRPRKVRFCEGFCRFLLNHNPRLRRSNPCAATSEATTSCVEKSCQTALGGSFDVPVFWGLLQRQSSPELVPYDLGLFVDRYRRLRAWLFIPCLRDPRRPSITARGQSQFD